MAFGPASRIAGAGADAGAAGGGVSVGATWAAWDVANRADRVAASRVDFKIVIDYSLV